MLLNQKMPLVSICIPTYNNARFLRECLDSIVNQTYQNKEIIVSDNVSTDETKKIVKEYVEKYKVKYYKNEKNIGAEANFTRCIELTKGEYIAIFHADDLYMLNIIQRQIDTFQNNSAIGAVFTTAKRINSFSKIIGDYKLPVELNNKKIYYFSEIFLSILENGNFLICPSCMVKGRIYKELVAFNGNRFKTSADLDMWLRILAKCPIAILNEKLMSRRSSNTQGIFASTYLRTKQADFFKVMDYYLEKSIVSNISHKTLNRYKALKYNDDIKRAINYLIKKQPQEAKNLLREVVFSNNIVLDAIGNAKRLKFFIYWCSSIVILCLIYIGLGKYLGKSLYWLMYTFRRRFIQIY